jgi:chorismate mutase-like protein
LEAESVNEKHGARNHARSPFFSKGPPEGPIVPAHPARMDETRLKELRNSIDSVDREIIRRLNERLQLACEIGRLKLSSGKEIYVPSREEEVFGKLTAHNEGPLPETAIRRIYREIISAAIAHEKPLMVAYLGPEGTYTQQAALKNFGSSINNAQMRTVPDVFTAVKRGDADYGVVPIENSTQVRSSAHSICWWRATFGSRRRFTSRSTTP